MTIYYSTYDSNSTGTYSLPYNNYMQSSSTTTNSSMDYKTYVNSNKIDSGTRYSDFDYFSTGMTISPSWTSRQYDSTYIGSNYIVGIRKASPKPTEQELARLEEERIKAAEERKKAREEAEEAARKARLLLTECLDQENMQRLLKKEPLEVSSRLFGDIKYHIPISNHARIKALRENKVITELCLTVKESGLPTDDIVLAKFLHVLHDEENVLRTANHFNKQENLLARLN